MTPDTSAEETAEDRAADVAYLVRASQTPPHHLIDVHAGDVVRWLREIAAARARLPSPESVTRARLAAAEIVEVQIAQTTHWDPDSARWVANVAAQHIRDRADTHVDPSEEGHADPGTLLMLAQQVGRCTTLGELEALVAQWREVSGG